MRKGHTVSRKAGVGGRENTESPVRHPCEVGMECRKHYFCRALVPAKAVLTDGVTGNTSDFGSEESRFEP